jgi:acetyl-CoA carboxylase carboxyl transferase subunit alpha
MSDTPISGNGSTSVLEFERAISQMEIQIAEFEATQERTGRDFGSEIKQLRSNVASLIRKTYSRLSAWETVQLARHKDRPLARDYIDMLVHDFVELRGDRLFGDDRAMICGFGRLADSKVMIIAQHKGRDTKEKIECNFGLTHPEGYRKALHKMRTAEKFGLPVVTLIDTQGAYPGVGAEERGVAEAIAQNMKEMSRLRTPIVSVVIGEGGSGGALGIGVADRLAVMQYGYYSVITPEGCAAILWRSSEYAAEAAEALKLTSRELARLGIVDEVIPEPVGGAHRDAHAAAQNLKKWISQSLRELRRVKVDNLVSRRYKRLRSLGSDFVVG